MYHDAKYQVKILIYVISMTKRNCDFASSTSKNRFPVLQDCLPNDIVQLVISPAPAVLFDTFNQTD